MAVPSDQAETIERLRRAVRDLDEAAGDLDALVTALSRWEERARDSEAEVAAMRWEVRIAGEKLVALVNRLVELENAPARRLRRRLRSEPARVSAADVTKAAE
jgi:chromosome segregation ATPase